MMIKKAVIYARVSTDEQAEKGYSLNSQIEKCREFAQAENVNIVAEITDDYSGVTLERPGFIELESMLARKEADAVIVMEEDRLSRNAANTLTLYNEWPDSGIALGYCETGWVNFGEESILINGVPILVAQYERVKIRKRTMNGRYNKAKSGKPVLNGPPPYGYRANGKGHEGKLVKYEPELKVVRDIFEWYTKGDETGIPLSQREIARKLNKLKIPSTTPSKKWSNTAIHRILHQEIYAGVTYYGKTKTKSKGDKRIVVTKLPKEEWIKIPVPHLAIIDRQTFNAVEARKERNKQLQLRNNKRKYLMSGHFRCSCGQVIVGYHRQGYLRYQCSTHWNSTRPGYEPCPISNRSIVCHKIDQKVWDWICELLTDDVALDEGLNKMLKNNRDETGTKRNRLETLKMLIAKSKRGIEKLVDDLSEGKYSHESTRAVFHQKIKELEDAIHELENERNHLEAELAQVEITDDFRREIKAMAARVRDKLSDASFAGKRAVMDKLDLKAVFRHEGDIRWLDLSCNLSPEGLSYNLLEG